ncbi:PAS domain S-box protein [Flavobacterium sp. 7A]|uniref:PAS domain S-box protein n=1 Tax=Flavobacterium sp. 7A TaxID=2940571 RepID=UPI0022278EC8|nr:PAS domain S-box protein [Flavobacterium sp. 7A]MCW2118889.1 PAS domain S-box-containing protein [Flavobacterium sp. 7A]
MKNNINLTNKVVSYINRFNKPRSIGLLVFLCLSILLSYIVTQQYFISEKEKKDEMNNDLKVIQQDIEKTLKNSYITALTLALTINDQGFPINFNAISKKLVESNPNISCVQLVPNGVITYVYPYTPNKAAIGFDILNSKMHQKEALKSIETQKMYFAGPFDLLQGGKGIVGRLPVYNNNKFWGFSAVTIRLEKLVSFFEKHTIADSRFYLQLSKKDPNTNLEIFFLNGSFNFSNLNYVSTTITDGDWTLYLINKDPIINIDSKIIIIATFGFILSVLIGIGTTSVLKKPAELRVILEEQANNLLNSELKFKSFFDQAAVGIANINKLNGKFIAINGKFCKLLGYSPTEMKTKSFMEITHPEDLENDLQYLRKLKDGIINKYSIEKRYFKKNGKVIWVKLTVSHLITISGKSSSYISIIENITKRKTAEQNSKEYQKKIESLINTIDGIVWECDAKTFVFSFISKKVEAILGYTSREWLSTPNFWQDHIHPDDLSRTINYCNEKIKKYEDHDFEYRMIAKDGSIVWLRDIINIIRKNDEAISLRGIMINITKTKEIQTELNNSFELVTEQNKRLLNFSYIVSHNLRSHTSNITSLTDLIETSDSEEETQEYVQLLKNVSNALNETLENLNEVVNIQSNLGLVVENINLSEYINNTLVILSDKIKSKKAIIITTVANDIELIYNPAYFESILYNLISNAIRYSHPERVPEISISITTENNFKILTITDNGIGIDLVKHGDKIFGMYKTFSNNPESKGIGLFITKNQIEAMGGKISIESKPNVGTTFKIYIS